MTFTRRAPMGLLLAVLATMSMCADAMFPCQMNLCNALIDDSLTAGTLHCGGQGQLISDVKVTIQSTPFVCSGYELNSTSVTNETTGCDADLLKAAIVDECEKKENCDVDLASVPISKACPAWSQPTTHVSVTAVCKQKVDILPYLVLFVTFIISFGVGNSVEVDAWKRAFKKEWKGVIIGFICQYGIMPAFGFAIAKIFLGDYPKLVSVGLILCGSVPGGSTSNLMTMIAKGNVALSMIMSAASGLASLGFLPLLTYIYVNVGLGVPLEEVPWADMFMGIAVIVLSPFCGFLVRKFFGHILVPIPFNKEGKKIEFHKILSGSAGILGIVFLIVVIAVGIKGAPYYFTELSTTWDSWIIGLTFQPIGSLFGYGLARICRFGAPECRAIALETGIQNITLAMLICSLAYIGCERYYGLYLVLSVSLFIVPNSLAIGGFLRFLSRYDKPADNQVAPGDGNTDEKQTNLKIMI